jgi:hypothetical protein
MLLSTVTLTSGGLLTYTAAIGAVNNLSISVAGGVYTLSDSGEIITLSGRANSRCLGDGTNTVPCPDSDVTALSVVLDDMNDLLSIQSTSDPATVSGGEGGDAVTARHNGLGAGLNVSDTGSTGTDSLSINSTAAGPETIGIASTQITRSLSNTIIYSGQETLIVTGTGSSDTINVTSTAAGSATLVDALDGGDSVTVTQSAVGPASLQVADSGTTGVDTLISNTASVGPEAIGISSTEVTRSSGGPVSYSGQESLTVNGSAASDTVTVTGTAPGTATTLNGQGGTACRKHCPIGHIAGCIRRSHADARKYRSRVSYGRPKFKYIYCNWLDGCGHRGWWWRY